MKCQRIQVAIYVAAVTLSAALFSGCGTLVNAPAAPTPIAGAALQGSVYGGQQPVALATIAMYAAVTSGYRGPTTNLLNQTVQTDGNGAFSLRGAYSCTPGQQLYIVATGGNAGAGVNPNLSMMSAIGDCASVTSATHIKINEVTTVGSVFALSPFMAGITALGTDATNTSGLVHAFASVNKLVNIATGVAPGSALPVGATGPTNEVNTLANTLAACINSTGGVASDGSACGTLFTLATPSTGAAPTDTVQALLNIAHSPTQNVAALYTLGAPTAPFGPSLSSAPNDWTMAVFYSSAAFNRPATTTVDAQGNIWVANTGGNSITPLAQTGVPLSGSPFTGNGLNGPSAIAIDAGGNAWVANSGGSTVSTFTSTGGIFTGSPFAGAGTISTPSSIAIDAPGNIWIANKGNSSITKLTSAGTYSQQVSTGGATPASLAIDPK